MTNKDAMCFDASWNSVNLEDAGPRGLHEMMDDADDDREDDLASTKKIQAHRTDYEHFDPMMEVFSIE